MGRKGLLAAIFVIAGIATLCYGVLTVADAFASSRWPTTSGRLISSQVIRTTGGTGLSRSSGYEPVIAYTYSVDGTEYEGSRISFRSVVFATRSEAELIARGYTIGAEVTVAYDPDDPATATLETTVSAATFVLPGFGAVLLIAGIIFTVRAARTVRSLNAS